MCCWKLEVDAIGSNFRDIQILFFREEHRLMVFENRVVNRAFGEKKEEVTGEWGSSKMMSFIICTHSQISLDR
jgi:hypothetical protein